MTAGPLTVEAFDDHTGGHRFALDHTAHQITASMSPEDDQQLLVLALHPNAGDRMPGTLEASEGGAPEVTVHKEEALAGGSELSPEEQAMNLPTAEPDDDVESAGIRGFGDVGWRRNRAGARVRVIETHHLQPTRPRLAARVDVILRVDHEAGLGRRRRVPFPSCFGDRITATQEEAAALLRRRFTRMGHDRRDHIRLHT